MDITKRALGIFADCLILLIKEHEPSKTVFQLIRQRMLSFIEQLNKKAGGTFSVVQTGSSYDELHLSRVLFRDDKGRDVIYPPIDFDFMMNFEEYKILDRSMHAPAVDETFKHLLQASKMHDPAVDETLKHLLQASKCFAIMLPAVSPGYVKIMVTDAGRKMLQRPQCEIENEITRDGFLPNLIFKKKALPEQLQEGVELLYSRQLSYVSSGPALTNMDNEAEGFTYDFVHAFPCETWPDLAVNWTKRYRPYDWPPKHVLQDIIQGGCAVVPVGHHLSEKNIQELEWRVSFNAGERKLSKCLLPSQRGCYSLVKLILKTSLSARSIITSYHVKNMMFWFCEQQYGNQNDWSVETQGDQILEFLDYIANALAHHSIPHYFVPPNNMISHRTKQEIDDTRREVIQVKEKIVTSILLACIKLRIFDKSPSQVRSGNADTQTLLTIYVSFVKILYKLGIDHLTTKETKFWNLDNLSKLKIDDMEICSELSARCFSNVIALNRCFKEHVTNAPHAFLAQSVPELLKALAQGYTKAGELNKALASYQIMLGTDQNRVKSEFPEVFSNLACLYANMHTTVPNKDQKQHIITKAKEYFHKALTLINDSSSLHLAFGNFLVDNKISVISAMDQFEKATKVEVPRADDDALIQLTVPGRKGAVSDKVFVSGNVAALYMLCSCHIRMDDIYQARTNANYLENLLRACLLKQKYSHFQICAFAYRACGLHAKSEIIMEEAKKYSSFQ